MPVNIAVILRIILSTGFFLAVLPFFCGLIIAGYTKKEEQTVSNIYIMGFITYLGIFEIVYTPYVLLQISFNLMCNTLNIVYGIIFLLSLIFRRKLIMQVFSNFSGNIRGALKNNDYIRKFLWLVPLALIGLQLYMSFFYQYLDGDDAYYASQSLSALETTRMYLYLPYTGATTQLDIRHLLSGITIFDSYLSKMVGVHTSIMAHSILPLFLIVLAYQVYYNIGKKLFAGEPVKGIVFLTVAIVMQLFGNTTIYSNATFFLTRTWQGKAVMAGFIIPVTFLILLQMAERMKETNDIKKVKTLDLWIYLVLVMIAGECCTTMSAYLLPLMTGAGILLIAVLNKKPKLLLPMILSFLPSVIYGILYVMF